MVLKQDNSVLFGLCLKQEGNKTKAVVQSMLAIHFRFFLYHQNRVRDSNSQRLINTETAKQSGFSQNQFSVAHAYKNTQNKDCLAV